CLVRCFLRFASLPPLSSPLFPYTTLFRSEVGICAPGSVVVMLPAPGVRDGGARGAYPRPAGRAGPVGLGQRASLVRLRLVGMARSEEHTSELQSRFDLVCRLLLEKKKPN